MLTKKQNLLETIHGGNPDRFVNQFEALGMIMANPVSARNRRPGRGEPPHHGQLGRDVFLPGECPRGIPHAG